MSWRRSIQIHRSTWLAVLAAAAALVSGSIASVQTAQPPGVPRFDVDPTWPRLPNGWVLGTSINVSIDRHDHVWIIHRSRLVPAELKERAAPPVLEFDQHGKFLQAWGGPADGYDWPDLEHGITVDYKDRVWVSGSNPVFPSGSPRSDDMLVLFSTKGRFLFQVGRRDASGGNKDPKNMKRPCEVFVYKKTNEAFIADGYGNRRVIVLDADTGAFKRMWGGFGNEPLDPPPPSKPGQPPPTAPREGPGPQQFGTVHGVKVSHDGFVYVADRNNQRIQVFTLDGKYLNQVFIDRNESANPGPEGGRTVSGIALSTDKNQDFIYVADYSNSHVVIVRRKPLEVVGSFGIRSPKPGDFQGIHNLAVDSKGNLYTAESDPGNRAQRFVFKGVS